MSESGIPAALYEKNAQEFVEVTRRIQEALVRLESDTKLKATQEVLAQLANCSRGTLSNRRWPLERLREIKNARKVPKQPITDGSKAAVNTASRIERYKEQLYNSREEVLIWKARYDQVSERLAESLNVARVLQARLKEAEDELTNLRSNSRPKIIDFSVKSPK
ncbi:hypothetical protein [Orrella marina]|uniref:Uncharacterized protein n=1 Tax=Orrella marina TaxID=2163011 RepID=A0A2R4XGZ4_9BURK|nr:hypothetical protein [Orrella marina]AWB33082.1 hypothetical protein DBV39_04415 [Orrella marina]